MQWLVVVGLGALFIVPAALATEPTTGEAVQASEPDVTVTEDATVAVSESADADSDAVEAGVTVDATADGRTTTDAADEPRIASFVPDESFVPDAAPRHAMMTQTYAVAHPELAAPAVSTVFAPASDTERTARAILQDAGVVADDVPEVTPTAETTSDEALSPVHVDASASSTSDDPVHVTASAQAAGAHAGADSSQMPTPASYGAYPWGASDETPAEPAPDSAPAAAADERASGPAFALGGDVVPAVPDAVAAALAVTAVFGAASATAGFLFIPGWRAALSRAVKASPLAFLFSRIAKDDVLDHPKRAEIYEFVTQNPGERVEAVRKALGYANGTMLHHLQVLRDKDLVRKVKQGGITRLFPAGPKIDPLPYLIPPRRAILEAVAAKPGMVQRQVGDRVDMSERMVSYHVKQLAGDGLVEVRRDGSCNRVYPAVEEETVHRLLEVPAACPVS